ncbi:MAG: LysR family transcriptional regulator, partial [Myxococcales bacterium]|nr:LysR family transcriptional regulator [Myxococcales bacterium]
MQRIVRLNQIWSWLPAFRAVAETEHVHEAALALHVTPSTLSRAIHLLEDDLGCALFRRVGRSLELTDDGRALLQALRDAMRGLDDALVAVTGRPTAQLRVAADDAVAMAAVMDALDTV